MSYFCCCLWRVVGQVVVAAIVVAAGQCHLKTSFQCYTQLWQQQQHQETLIHSSAWLALFFFLPLSKVSGILFECIRVCVCVCVSVHLKAVLPWKTVYLKPFEKR